MVFDIAVPVETNIYRKRERDNLWKTEKVWYIYIYIYIERERKIIYQR